MGRNYYPKKWKYIIRKKKIQKYINDVLEISADDSSEEDSNDEDN